MDGQKLYLDRIQNQEATLDNFLNSHGPHSLHPNIPLINELKLWALWMKFDIPLTQGSISTPFLKSFSIILVHKSGQLSKAKYSLMIIDYYVKCKHKILLSDLRRNRIA